MSMSYRPLCTLALSLLIATLSPLAAAAQSTDLQPMLDRGIALREEGKDREALEVFDRAYRDTGSARALTQRALAEQALGLWVKAAEDLSRALESTDPWIEEHRGLLEGELGKIRKRLGRLDVQANVEDAKLHVNAERTFDLPLDEPVRVVAGEVPIEVTAPGHLTVRRTVSVDAGALGRETVRLVPDSGQAADSGVAGTDDDATGLTAQGPGGERGSADGGTDTGGSRWWLWTTLGLVAAGAAAAATAVALTRDGGGEPDYARSDVGGVTFALGGR